MGRLPGSDASVVATEDEEAWEEGEGEEEEDLVGRERGNKVNYS